jgi:hypothetical protein
LDQLVEHRRVEIPFVLMDHLQSAVRLVERELMES